MLRRPIEFPDPPLSANGIVLRGLFEEDADVFSALACHPSIAQDAFHGGLDLADPDVVRDWIRRARERMKEGTQVLLAVTDETDCLIGQTMLFKFEEEDLSAELGFWIAPNVRRKGLATTAIKLTCGWAFKELGVERICAYTTPANVAAQRSMERAGLQREGLHRGLEKVGDERWDMLSFAALASDGIGLP